MNLSEIHIASLFYIIPNDIKVALAAVFAFLCALAIWRIIR